MKRPVPRLHVITDTVHQTRYSHADLARLAVDGGADGIQFRQKTGTLRDILRQAEETREVCGRAGVTFLVNDRLDVALAVGADGLHVGQEDMPAATSRRLLGPDMLLGASTPSLELAEAALRDGADYGGLGPVYATSSKETGRPALGASGFESVARHVSLPLVAIGGVQADRVPELLGAGAYGVAVIAAVCCAEDVTRAADEFARGLRESA